MKILIPLDGSRFAEEILEPAARLATNYPAQVLLVQVLTPSEARATHAQSPNIQPALGYGLWGEDSVGAGEPYLMNLALRYFPEGTQSRVIVHENPAEGILNCARDEKADLIAMATHGRSGLSRLLMGSVADRLIRAGVVKDFYLVRPSRLKSSPVPE